MPSSERIPASLPQTIKSACGCGLVSDSERARIHHGIRRQVVSVSLSSEFLISTLDTFQNKSCAFVLLLDFQISIQPLETSGQLARRARHHLLRLHISNFHFNLYKRWVNSREEFEESSSFDLLMNFKFVFHHLDTFGEHPPGHLPGPPPGLRLGPLPGRLPGPLLDPLLDLLPDPPSKVTYFSLSVPHRSATLGPDPARRRFDPSQTPLLTDPGCACVLPFNMQQTYENQTDFNDS